MPKNPFRGGFSLRQPTSKPAAAAPVMALKEIPGEGVDAEGVGIVKGIRQGDEYGGLSLSRAKKKLAQVTIQFGEDPPELTKPQREKMDYDEREARRPPTTTFDVPPGMAKGLSLGDKVRVSIEKVGS